MHPVGFYHTSISRCTVLIMSKASYKLRPLYSKEFPVVRNKNLKLFVVKFDAGKKMKRIMKNNWL